MSLLKSKKLYNFITDWTGVKYRFGGLDKDGIDCSGFALLLQKEIYGMTLPRISRDQAKAVRPKDPAELKEGDLIFFAFGGAAVDHVGVYLNNNFFLYKEINPVSTIQLYIFINQWHRLLYLYFQVLFLQLISQGVLICRL